MLYIKLLFHVLLSLSDIVCMVCSVVMFVLFCCCLVVCLFVKGGGSVWVSGLTAPVNPNCHACMMESKESFSDINAFTTASCVPNALLPFPSGGGTCCCPLLPLMACSGVQPLMACEVRRKLEGLIVDITRVLSLNDFGYPTSMWEAQADMKYQCFEGRP